MSKAVLLHDEYSVPMTPPKPLVVGYSMITLPDPANPDITKIIESYMTSDGRWFYREHHYGFFPFNAWMEGMPAVLPVPPPLPTGNGKDEEKVTNA